MVAADEVPCVLALPLARARHILDEAGWPVLALTETRAPQRQGSTEAPRVMRQRARGRGVDLVVAAAAPRVWERAPASDGA